MCKVKYAMRKLWLIVKIFLLTFDDFVRVFFIDLFFSRGKKYEKEMTAAKKIPSTDS